ncbi:hypothetical protein KKH39_02745 [Patescibacteria group bacterium]|nr:hypothetical protein [Patescibacteria group bacterium]
MTNPSRAKGNIYSKVVIFFFFLTLVAILMIVHFALAKVKIKIYNNLENKTGSVLVEMQSEDTTEISPDAILGKIINTEFEISANIKSSQEMSSSEKAGGYVTIYNNYSKSQPLIKTTRLLTPDGKLFRISEGVTVPAGGQVEVWAEADQTGAEYVTEATTFIIPGLWEGLQDKIYAETTEGMKQTSIPHYSVSQENLDKVIAELKTSAEKKAVENINNILPENLSISAKQIIFEFEVVESSELGDVSEETSVTENVTAHALIFDQQKLFELAQEKFQKELASSQTLIKFNPDKFDYKILDINFEKEEAVIEVSLEAEINNGQNALNINKEDLVGLDENGLRQYFQDFKAQRIDIDFSPFWVKSAPRFKDHIIIE